MPDQKPRLDYGRPDLLKKRTWWKPVVLALGILALAASLLYAIYLILGEWALDLHHIVGAVELHSFLERMRN